MHGHNYEFEVYISAFVLRDDGFVLDFWELDKKIQPIIDDIDHRCLNDIEGLENPTAEIIARWLLKRIRQAIREYENIHDSKVQVWETKDCSAIVE